MRALRLRFSGWLLRSALLVPVRWSQATWVSAPYSILPGTQGRFDHPRPVTLPVLQLGDQISVFLVPFACYFFMFPCWFLRESILTVSITTVNVLLFPAEVSANGGGEPCRWAFAVPRGFIRGFSLLACCSSLPGSIGVVLFSSQHIRLTRSYNTVLFCPPAWNLPKAPI